jgi:hypothetical protein
MWHSKRIIAVARGWLAAIGAVCGIIASTASACYVLTWAWGIHENVGAGVGTPMLWLLAVDFFSAVFGLLAAGVAEPTDDAAHRNRTFGLAACGCCIVFVVFAPMVLPA